MGFSCPLGKLFVTAPNPFTHSRQPIARQQLSEGSESWKILDVKLLHGDGLRVEPRRQGSSDWGGSSEHHNLQQSSQKICFLKGKEFLD